MIKVQVWRVDLDGPGKFEAYRRKYILLFNALLRDTHDSERLELLISKLIKDPVVNQQYELLADLYASLFTVHRLVCVTARSLFQALCTQVLNSKIDELQARFDVKQANSSQIDLTEDRSPPSPGAPSWL